MANDGSLPTPFVTNQACETKMAHVYKVSPYLLQGPPLDYIRQQKFQCKIQPGNSNGWTLGCETVLSRATWTLTSVIWESSRTTPVETIHTGPSGGMINAYSVQLRYVAARETPGSTSTPTPSSETDGDSAAELQTGAAIGIGIGVTLAFVALVAAAVFIFVWMRRRQRNRKRSAEPASSLSPTKPEAHSDVPVSSAPSPPHDFVPNYQYTRALGYELDAREPAPEFPVDRHNTPEMPAQSPRGFRS
ncbi:hypothetical protein PG996_006868 [Apiospora saccharicola]|uniref:Mid2 domain-containing protein n=1 Tax=Apiospora saccharicola TaxID=335842 RepID=A0ABR1V992_9PEZI